MSCYTNNLASINKPKLALVISIPSKMFDLKVSPVLKLYNSYTLYLVQLFNRPGVAGAGLQTASLLSQSVSP